MPILMPKMVMMMVDDCDVAVVDAVVVVFAVAVVAFVAVD